MSHETIRDYNAGYYEEAAIAAAREPEPPCEVCGKHDNDKRNPDAPCPACECNTEGRDPVFDAKIQAAFMRLHASNPVKWPKFGCLCGCPSAK